jgi:hypothetical protein
MNDYVAMLKWHTERFDGYAEGKLHLKITGQNILSRHNDEMYSVAQDSVNLPLT